MKISKTMMILLTDGIDDHAEAEAVICTQYSCVCVDNRHNRSSLKYTHSYTVTKRMFICTSRDATLIRHYLDRGDDSNVNDTGNDTMCVVVSSLHLPFTIIQIYLLMIWWYWNTGWKYWSIESIDELINWLNTLIDILSHSWDSWASL